MTTDKIYLVNPGIKEKKTVVDYPLNLAYLVTALKSNNFNVEIIDMFYNTSEDVFLNTIFLTKPMMVGITCTTPVFNEIITLAGKIKRISPESHVVLGGHHVTSIAQSILEQYYQIDSIVLYEGEITLCRLAHALLNHKKEEMFSISGFAFRSGKEIYINKKHEVLDLDKYPQPDWDAMISPKEMLERGYFSKIQASINTMRGCWAKCDFCESNSISRYRYKSLDSVSEEIDYLLEHYSIDYLYIQDLDFLKDIKRALKISEIINKKNIHEFQIITRADSLVKAGDFIETICHNGCVLIETGIESGSNTQLERYNKLIDAEVNSRAVSILNDLSKKTGVKYSISFIMFDPYVTITELEENYSFLESNHLNKIEN
jgi:radical SAM superfamily enzyme YgiQ (UPF0313 family)